MRVFEAEDGYTHDPVPQREMWASVGWTLLGIICKLPLCRVGLHDDCGCCSPGACVRCGRHQASEERPGLRRRAWE